MADKDPMRELLENIAPYSYEYVDLSVVGTAPGRRFGVMAQDLEKSEAGRSIVFEVDGIKKINTGQGLILALGALAYCHERIKALEDLVATLTPQTQRRL